MFLKSGEIDLEFASKDDLMEIIGKFNNARSSNTYKEDPVFQDIYNRYKQVNRDFKRDGTTTVKIKEFKDSMSSLTREMQVLNENNNSLTNRYQGSEEYMRIHKRIVENYSENLNNINITTYKVMVDVIAAIDNLLGHMAKPSKNVVIRELLRPVRDTLKRQGFADVSKRQVENIIYLFIDDKFTEIG